MKQILIALLLAFTTSTVINAQKQSSIEKDSTENVKVTLSKKTDTKADESNTTVTVIGVDTTAGKDANSVSSSGSSHGKVGFTFESDDNDLPFGNLSDTISGGILISIIAIVAVFGLPVFILFVIFFMSISNCVYMMFEHGSSKGIMAPPRVGNPPERCPGAAGKLYPRKPAGRPTLTRHQKHLYRDRTFHLPLGDHRRVRNRSNRTAYHVYGHRPMDNRQQTTENR